MRHAWQPGQVIMLPTLPQRAVSEILLEYDGPQLVLLNDETGQRFLGLAVDESDRLMRWIQSPVSDLEIEAMKCGALSVRNALLKPEMTLIDVDNAGHLVSLSQLKLADVPEEALPEVGALLPPLLRTTARATLDADGTPEFHLGGKEVSNGRMPFVGLSLIIANLQVLWNAIAPEFNAERAPLSAVAFGRGSFKVKVHVDNLDLFSRIADTYYNLTNATYDEDKLTELLSRAKPRVAFAYSEYLKALDINKLEVLGKWTDGAAFVGYEGARRARRQVRVALQGQPEQPEVVTLRGYLEGWGRQPQHFEFYDSDSGQRLVGTVSKALRSIPLDVEIRLGHRIMYKVEIQAARRGDKPPRYTLLSFRPIDE